MAKDNISNNTASLFRKQIIRGTSGSLFLKIAYTVLTLFLTVLLARILGVEKFGVYAFCLSIVQILIIPAMLGGQQLLVREVAAYKIKSEYHYLRGLLARFKQVSIGFSVLISVVAGVIGFWIYRENNIFIPFLLAIILVPFFATLQLQCAVLRGLHHVLLGQVPMMLRPGLVLLFVLIIYWYLGSGFSAEAALLSQIVASVILVLLTFFLLRRSLPNTVKIVNPDYETQKWDKSVLPFVFAGGMQVLNGEISVLMLGFMETPKEVGLFRVAQRGALLIPFALQAVNMAVAPTISELFAKGEKKRLQYIVSRIAFGVFAISLPVALGLMLGGKWIIPVVFGIGYAPAYFPLVVLCLGQLVNVSMGSVGLLLNMAGFENLTARGVTIATLSNAILNFVLIPFWGASGAAIATSLSLALWNVVLFSFLYKQTGIISSIRLSAFRLVLNL